LVHSKTATRERQGGLRDAEGRRWIQARDAGGRSKQGKQKGASKRQNDENKVLGRKEHTFLLVILGMKKRKRGRWERGLNYKEPILGESGTSNQEADEQKGGRVSRKGKKLGEKISKESRGDPSSKLGAARHGGKLFFWGCVETA